MPKRFSVGTGVLISASGATSPRTDIVIFDNNSPLLSEFGVGMYPVEIVYATIEVKSTLTKSELRSSLRAIRKTREMGSRKHYVVPTVSIDAEGTRTVVTHPAISKVPPRSYVVAFGQRGLGKTYEAFCHTLKGYLDEHNDHVHGVAVLERTGSRGGYPIAIPPSCSERTATPC